MESTSEVLDRHMDLPAFRRLENYSDLRRAKEPRTTGRGRLQ